MFEKTIKLIQERMFNFIVNQAVYEFELKAKAPIKIKKDLQLAKKKISFKEVLLKSPSVQFDNQDQLRKFKRAQLDKLLSINRSGARSPFNRTF